MPVPRGSATTRSSVVTSRFRGLDLLERHRARVAALGDLAARGVSQRSRFDTYTPDDWRQTGTDTLTHSSTPFSRNATYGGACAVDGR